MTSELMVHWLLTDQMLIRDCARVYNKAMPSFTFSQSRKALALDLLERYESHIMCTASGRSRGLSDDLKS